MNITGILRNAVRIPKGEDVRAPCLSGNVYCDARGRFCDGEWITTSTIVSEDDGVFTTRYSIYKVESWREQPANDNNPLAGYDPKASARAFHINNLVNYFHAKSSAAGWWDEAGRDLRNDKYVHATKLMLVVTELSEAMEGLRKGLMDDKLPHRKMAEVELADALIRIFDLAGVLGYDLGGAVVEKDAFNSVREDHKPGNRMIAGGKAY